jgi:folate-dependent phosphoribosylglycinamide formyltransferase PurN
MKIVTLIGGRAQHVHLVNAIAGRFGLDLVIAESTARRRFKGLTNKLRTAWAMRSARPFAQRLMVKVRNPREAATYDAAFGRSWRQLDPDVPLMRTPSVNSHAVQERLVELRPDVLVVHGTAIVAERIIATAPLALNLHWGLSPYYRGTHCTEWALIHHDPYNIGVTIHQLTQRIDGGGIIAQARVVPAAADTPLSINMKLTAAGTTQLLEALARVADGRTLEPVEQDLTRGYLTLNRQWSSDLRRHLARQLRDGALARMLDKPARKQRLPIVEPTSDGAEEATSDRR